MVINSVYYGLGRIKDLLFLSFPSATVTVGWKGCNDRLQSYVLIWSLWCERMLIARVLSLQRCGIQYVLRFNVQGKGKEHGSKEPAF